MDRSISPALVAEIEQALSLVADIRAARVVSSEDGVIQEIHVLALPSKTPKQLVRDIESTIMARFGIPVDHRKVSIAQLGAESMPHVEEPVRERAKIQGVNTEVAGVNAIVTVTMGFEDEAYIGRAEGPASQTSRLRLIAQATLNAVEQYAHGTYGFALEDVSIVQLGQERVAVACVMIVTPLGEQAFAGSALDRQNDRDSIVRATLDAIDRRLGFFTTT